MISIVIPANNEEATIGRCLTNLLEGETGPELNITVVCNGCKDRTANVARQFGDRVRVVETDVASKWHALNLGDDAAEGFPRFYMDADVTLTPHDINLLVNALEGGLLAAAPRMKMCFSGSSWAVRAFYRVWSSLPYVRDGMIGVGVYVLSEEGRSRFGRFPDIIADDGYVRLLFKPHERGTASEAVSIVAAPATLAGLIKIKTRSRLGGYQLAERFPSLLENDRKNYGSAFIGVAKRPSLWLCAPVYFAVNLIARWRARKQRGKLDRYVWERDGSSRKAPSLFSAP